MLWWWSYSPPSPHLFPPGPVSSFPLAQVTALLSSGDPTAGHPWRWSTRDLKIRFEIRLMYMRFPFSNFPRLMGNNKGGTGKWEFYVIHVGMAKTKRRIYFQLQWLRKWRMRGHCGVYLLREYLVLTCSSGCETRGVVVCSMIMTSILYWHSARIMNNR